MPTYLTARPAQEATEERQGARLLMSPLQLIIAFVCGWVVGGPAPAQVA